MGGSGVRWKIEEGEEGKCQLMMMTEENSKLIKRNERGEEEEDHLGMSSSSTATPMR